MFVLLLSQGLRARDKELHALQEDIYEMKCHLLKIIDPHAPLPRRPKHRPLPYLDIQEPSPPLLAGGKWQALFSLIPSRKRLSPASEKRRKTGTRFFISTTIVHLSTVSLGNEAPDAPKNEIDAPTRPS